MADLLILTHFLQEKNIDFESFYKDFMNDNIDEALLNDQIVTTLKRSVNSMRFWGRKMEKMIDDKMIILTTYTTGPPQNVSNLDIFKALSLIKDLDCIHELYFPENQRYVGIIFKTVEDADFIRRNFKKVGDNFVIFVHWMAEAKLYKGRFHWLPNNIDLSLISSFVADYFIIKDIKKTKSQIAEGLFVNTNVVEFEGLLKIGVDLDKIPHFFQLADLKALITIKGRSPLCLGCSKIGHTKKNCDYSFCNFCKANLHKSHDCNDFSDKMLYSNVLNKTKQQDSNEIRDSSSVLAEEDVDEEKEVNTDQDQWIQVRRPKLRTYEKIRKPVLNSAVNKKADILYEKMELNVSVAEQNTSSLVVAKNESLINAPEGNLPALKRKIELISSPQESGQLNYNLSHKCLSTDDKGIATMNLYQALDQEGIDTDDS